MHEKSPKAIKAFTAYLSPLISTHAGWWSSVQNNQISWLFDYFSQLHKMDKYTSHFAFFLFFAQLAQISHFQTSLISYTFSSGACEYTLVQTLSYLDTIFLKVQNQCLKWSHFSLQDGSVFCTYGATCESESDESSGQIEDWAFMTKASTMMMMIEEFYAF